MPLSPSLAAASSITPGLAASDPAAPPWFNNALTLLRGTCSAAISVSKRGDEYWLRLLELALHNFSRALIYRATD